MFFRPRKGARRLPLHFPLWRHALARWALVCVCFVAMQLSPLGDQLDIHLAHKLLFRVRNIVGGPGVDPKIKVFSYDDGTASAIQDLDLSLDEWALVVKALAKQKPKAILFDKIFDKPYPPEDVRRFAEALADLPVPLVADSFVAGIQIPFRQELPKSAARHVHAYTADPFSALAWLPVHGGYLYGAPDEIRGAFRGTGHAVYHNDGYVLPLRRLSEEYLVPHWALVVAESVRLTPKGAWVNGAELPLDKGGRTLVNLDQRKVYSSRAYSMLPLIQYARAGKAIPVVEENDYVVLLPAMYTGSTDWKETPHGSMPGGYVMIAMLNSVITGKWVRQFGSGSVATLLLTVIGLGFAVRLPSVMFWPTLSGTVVGILGLMMVLFLKFDVVMSLIVPSFAMVLVSIAVFVKLEDVARVEQVRIEREVDTARLVQASFIPSAKIVGESIAIDGYYLSASECGGDFWRHFSVGPGLDYLIIGDATGHGLPAALVTAIAYSACATMDSLLQREPHLEHAPGRLLEVMNEVLHQTHDIDATMTCFVALFDRQRMVVRYANSGHPFPLLVRASHGESEQGGASCFSLLASGNVLGFGANQRFEEKETMIQAGDKIVLYSDGLLENRNFKGQVWGRRSLQKSIVRHHHHDLIELKDRIIEDYLAFSESAPREDDVTIVVAEVLAAPESEKVVAS